MQPFKISVVILSEISLNTGPQLSPPPRPASDKTTTQYLGLSNGKNPAIQDCSTFLLFSNIFLCTKVLTQRNKNNKLKVEYEKVLSDLNDTQTELRNTKIELDNKNTINTEKEE